MAPKMVAPPLDGGGDTSKLSNKLRLCRSIGRRLRTSAHNPACKSSNISVTRYAPAPSLFLARSKLRITQGDTRRVIVAFCTQPSSSAVPLPVKLAISSLNSQCDVSNTCLLRTPWPGAVALSRKLVHASLLFLRFLSLLDTANVFRCIGPSGSSGRSLSGLQCCLSRGAAWGDKKPMPRECPKEEGTF